MLTIFFTGAILKNHIKVIKIKYLNIKYRITMSHFLFFVSRNTQLNKAAIGCPFSFNKQTQILFDTMVVLLMSTLSTFGVTFSDVLAPLIGVLMATLNVVHYRRFTVMAWRHWRSSVTHSLQHSCCSIRLVVLLLRVGRLYTFLQYT
jgi:hypothetical protein